MIPLMLLLFLIVAMRGSVNKAKSDGESEHPCRVPWCSVKLGKVILFVVIVALGDVYSVCILPKTDPT